MLNLLARLTIQQMFSKPSLVNVKPNDTHLLGLLAFFLHLPSLHTPCPEHDLTHDTLFKASLAVLFCSVPITNWHLFLSASRAVLINTVSSLSCSLKGKQRKYINPYKPGVFFVGHWQTVQNQLRRSKMRCLIRFSTVYKQKFLLKFK